jgi:small subunit ribosomal protein S17
VRVERRRSHPLYRKVIRLHRRYKAHDEDSAARIGDIVLIEESRPISRDKRWRVVGLLSKGAER